VADKPEREMTRAEWLAHDANRPTDNEGPPWEEWVSGLPDQTRQALTDDRPRDEWGFLLPPNADVDATPPTSLGVKKMKRDPNQPSTNRQSDILAAIVESGTPLHRDEIRDAMKLKAEGKLGHHLAWMVKNCKLVNTPGQGYWPFWLKTPQ